MLIKLSTIERFEKMVNDKTNSIFYSISKVGVGFKDSDFSKKYTFLAICPNNAYLYTHTYKEDINENDLKTFFKRNYQFEQIKKISFDEGFISLVDFD